MLPHVMRYVYLPRKDDVFRIRTISIVFEPESELAMVRLAADLYVFHVLVFLVFDHVLFIVVI